MKVLIQRVKEASVTINSKVYSSINKGILVLFGVEKTDKKEFIDFMVNKIVNLRIFSDSNGKMNLNIKDINGQILVVSQFTLASNCKKGCRPSFDNAQAPDIANEFYEKFTLKLGEYVPVKTGVFGANMEVMLVNDGPVTFMLEK